MSPRRKQPKLSESAWSKAIDAVRARENLASRSGKPSPDELQAEASADRMRDRINQVSPKKSRPGYTRKDGVYVPPVRSPKQDREHDDIARRDQASADAKALRVCNSCGKEWTGGPECPACYAEDSSIVRTA